MDPRTAAHVLTRIAALLEVQGDARFRARAYRTAARAVLTLETDDIGPLLRSGRLAALRGVGPASISVLSDLVESGESAYLARLLEEIPEGVLEMLRVPGLGTAKLQKIRDATGVSTVAELAEAARDGRLASLPGFGPRTAEKILRGIAFMGESEALSLLPAALAEGELLLTSVRRHPGVQRAELAGSLRRRREVIADVDIVAACAEPPAKVAQSFANAPGVKEVTGAGARSISLRHVDGVRLNLHCVHPPEFAVALWRATGSDSHVQEIRAHAASRGFAFALDELRDASGATLEIATEHELYAALGLAFIPPELREGRGEVAAAADGRLPLLVRYADIQGALHCHSDYSDGKASIAEMAAAAQERGWSYLGISDHSESAFYAGGLRREAIVAQHEEIDRVNATFGNGFRVLKGIEADILADGRVDYDDKVLESFDYVIGSIHSRFAMTEAQMTARVLAALDDPWLTILGHPTGRLLLTREPYAIDMDAVLEKAGQVGVAVELNADPHRLDIDWRLCAGAKDRGVLVEIGPDAHSVRGLDNMQLGVDMARKGWLEAGDVLNALDAEGVLARARARRR